jgi:hypothetical protein
MSSLFEIVTVIYFCFLLHYKPITVVARSKVGHTPACVKTCNSQDTMSATWRKEWSTVETNGITKTTAHRSEPWCWRQLLSFLSHALMLVLTHLVCGRPKAWTAFANSNAGIVGSNPTRGMNVCVRLFCVCIVLCVGRGLATVWSPVQGVLLT